MYSAITSGTVHGIGSCLVQVEADISKGLPCFQMVGLLGSEVKEARERVKVALKNAGILLPPMCINVSLSPADLRKEGAAFDLPVAVSILEALEYLPKESAKGILIIGELGLSGEVKPVKGALPIVMEAKKRGIRICMLPKDNAMQGAVVQEMEIIGISHIKEALQYLLLQGEDRRRYIKPLCGLDSLWITGQEDSAEPDFAEVAGQESVKRAAEIAAAGFHHFLMAGPPGSGKTMIAKRMPSILPPLSLEESMEVTTIYSIAGLLAPGEALKRSRPFITPHHTITKQALAGGGRVPSPGMVTLAHRGILFLDELTEFKRETIDLLRQPLEEKKIQIARNSGSYIYPADFMLVGAMNPCPCGYYPNLHRCRCTPYEVHRYQARISGPVLDRIDICVETPVMEMSALAGNSAQESSRQIRARVLAARQIQQKRFAGSRLTFNTDMGVREIRRYCLIGMREERFLEQAFGALHLTARSYHRILKVARTIADLAGEERIKEEHLAEALCYRVSEHKFIEEKGGEPI